MFINKALNTLVQLKNSMLGYRKKPKHNKNFIYLLYLFKLFFQKV